jgi:hypothetical protein
MSLHINALPGNVDTREREAAPSFLYDLQRGAQIEQSAEQHCAAYTVNALHISHAHRYVS